MSKRVLIMGAAGKDFHVFNTLYRGDAAVQVVAFTAAQIPGIDGRKYPAQLAGAGYASGIPIEPESRLDELIRAERVDEVVFAYSDVSYDYVEERARRARAAGARFTTPDPRAVMLRSSRPVVAVTAVRTGSGKSQTSRRVVRILRELGKRVVAVRHPMPYGDLVRQRVQRFASIRDLEVQNCTIEEMEEYEPHIQNQAVVYSGVDYAAILAEAETEADVIVWDGGNNDTPFYAPDLHLVIVDPHRPGHEVSYYPGRENLELAHVVLFNKMDSADPANVRLVEDNVRRINPQATLVYARSPIHVTDPDLVRGKRVLVIEDGPTLTHGGMKFGAGVLAARQYGARDIVDPRPWLVGSIADTFRTYPGIGTLVPAMGYGGQQMRDLEATINAVDCDTVVIATPIDLGRVLRLGKPSVRVTYELDDYSEPNLETLLRQRLA
jgi:predicted GTPase